MLKEDAPNLDNKDVEPRIETNQGNIIQSEPLQVSDSTIMQPQLVADPKMADSEIDSADQEVEQKDDNGESHVEKELETSQNTEITVEEIPTENQEIISESNLQEYDQKTELDATDESKVGKIPVKEIKPLLLSVDGKSSPNSEGSFDIVRKESVQPLEIEPAEVQSQEKGDDEWGGWDDSPDSALEKY